MVIEILFVQFQISYQFLFEQLVQVLLHLGAQFAIELPDQGGVENQGLVVVGLRLLIVDHMLVQVVDVDLVLRVVAAHAVMDTLVHEALVDQRSIELVEDSVNGISVQLSKLV